MAQNGAASKSRQQSDGRNAAAEAKQVLVASDQGGFVLNDENLKAILLADGTMDKRVIVISVAGAFRKGKSFLLDMMCRYLAARNKSNWIHEQTTKGFPWRSGRTRHTTGILMWSQPIPVTLPDGTEAVILLMDTQGTFDNESTARESSTVFALSTLLSSLQVFNLMGNLQNDDLEHLQLFTEYGRMALDDTDGTKPFQKLLILVRDWQFDLPLGAQGGDRLVKEWLEKQTGKSELKQVRQHIRDCFSEITGFLLPHPGPNVTNPNFSGKSTDMDPTFRTHLEELMPKLLAPENLTVKNIAGNPVTAGELYTYFTVYTNLFSSDELPQPTNIVQATAVANNIAAAHQAKTQYIKEMECLLRDDEPSLGQDQLFKKHRESSDKAIKAFSDRKKMGDKETSKTYHTALLKDIEDWFKFAEQANNTKRGKERLNVENHNLALMGTCKMTYKSEMEPVAGEDVSYVTVKDMGSAHAEAKRKAMDQFDAGKKTFDGVEKESRRKLFDEIDAQFHQMLVHNEVKKDVNNLKAAQANNKATNTAKRQYQTMMNAMLFTGNTLTAKELQTRHQAAMKAAVEMFESLKEGDELITTSYLENMKSDIDREMQAYVRTNELKTEMDRLQTLINKMENQVEDAKKPTFSVFERVGVLADGFVENVGKLGGTAVEKVSKGVGKASEKVADSCAVM